MVLVPCCQAEIAACLRENKALALSRTPLAELWRHPLHTREIGSQLTNVLRCLYLEASGYQVTVTELVGWEHSMKNELIIARRTGQRKAQRGRAAARAARASSACIAARDPLPPASEPLPRRSRDRSCADPSGHGTPSPPHAPGHPHHVIQRGNNRQPIFAGPRRLRDAAGLLDENAAQASASRCMPMC